MLSSLAAVARSGHAHAHRGGTHTRLGGAFQVPIPAAVILHMIEECSQLACAEASVASAASVERLATSQEVALPPAAYGKLLMVYVRTANPLGPECFRRMASAGHGLCMLMSERLIARCVFSQNVQLAESVTEWLTSRSEMSLEAFKLLMKVMWTIVCPFNAGSMQT